jgi:hypothetical protein
MTKQDYAQQEYKQEKTIPNESVVVALIAVTGFLFTLFLLLSLTK